MAFDLNEIISQVTSVVGHDGLADKVPTWTNRVVQTIGCRAVWRSQLVSSHAATQASVTTLTQAVASQLNPLTSLSSSDIIQIYQVAYKTATAGTYSGVLRRFEAADLFAQMYGQSVNKTTGNELGYAVGRYASTTSGTTVKYMVPNLVVYPLVSAGVLEVSFLQAPAKFDDGTGTNHFLQKYFSVVLSGVLRIVRLYLGDVNGYLAEKAVFENGLREMIQAEEVMVASTPAFRSVDPPWYGRG